MQRKNAWQPTKFILNQRGQLIASRNKSEVNPSSLLIADLTAKWYDSNIKEFAKGRLLDLGCGKAPLYGTYVEYVDSVVLADWGNSLHENKHLDVVCDITKKLPFEDNSFDTIILSDVLEHLPNPKLLLVELKRILRNDGNVLINVPFMYWIHEAPYDYHRYTEFMLRKLVKDEGMDVVKLEALGGGYAVLIDLVAKLLKGKKAIFVQTILRKIFSKKINARTEFPISYALVCKKSKEE